MNKDFDFEINEGILHHEEGIDLMPANIELAVLETELASLYFGREKILRTYLNSVCLLSRYLQLTTLTSAPVMPESEQIQKSAKYSPLNPEQIHHEYG